MKALIEIKEHIDILAKALEPELKGASYERASWNYEKKGNTLLITLIADDATAFRAMINAITKILVIQDKARRIQ
jgi:tRNA threonylcarbamoyladenosine modification (KEOPS) complex  Pcc1 subunit